MCKMGLRVEPKPKSCPEHGIVIYEPLIRKTVNSHLQSQHSRSWGKRITDSSKPTYVTETLYQKTKPNPQNLSHNKCYVSMCSIFFVIIIITIITIYHSKKKKEIGRGQGWDSHFKSMYQVTQSVQLNPCSTVLSFPNTLVNFEIHW